jgi:hypothetical protein
VGVRGRGPRLGSGGLAPRRLTGDPRSRLPRAEIAQSTVGVAGFEPTTSSTRSNLRTRLTTGASWSEAVSMSVGVHRCASRSGFVVRHLVRHSTLRGSEAQNPLSTRVRCTFEVRDAHFTAVRPKIKSGRVAGRKHALPATAVPARQSAVTGLLPRHG